MRQLIPMTPGEVVDGRTLTQDGNGVQSVCGADSEQGEMEGQEVGEFVPVVTDRSVFKAWS